MSVYSKMVDWGGAVLLQPGFNKKTVITGSVMAAVAIGGVVLNNHWSKQEQMRRVNLHNPDSPNQFVR